MDVKAIIDAVHEPTALHIHTKARRVYDKVRGTSTGFWDHDEEEIMAADPNVSYDVASRLVKGPWPPGEPAIASLAHTACDYAVHILGNRFPAGEATIAMSPIEAKNYAANVIKGRWEQGEPAIATSSIQSYRYARDALHGPFPAGEKAISWEGDASVNYAIDLLKGRFKLGEPAIFDSYEHERYLAYLKDNHFTDYLTCCIERGIEPDL